mmetsp:Transcript_9527/g.14024  ORF Transcript_9527/g.14024 Transcript_9527/m.14024 type:complete len:190 (+) Transcript_9527:178-747(+)
MRSFVFCQQQSINRTIIISDWDDSQFTICKQNQFVLYPKKNPICEHNSTTKRKTKRIREEMLDHIQYDIKLVDDLSRYSRKINSERDIVLAVVTQNGHTLIYAAKELKDDREIVMAVVRQNRCALQYASEELSADRDIVMAAITQYGNALRIVPKEFRADKEVLLTAISVPHNWTNIGHTHISKELLRD